MSAIQYEAESNAKQIWWAYHFMFENTIQNSFSFLFVFHFSVEEQISRFNGGLIKCVFSLIFESRKSMKIAIHYPNILLMMFNVR